MNNKRGKKCSKFKLTDTPARVAKAFSEGSPARKIGVIAAGVALVATSPYWAPAMVRSKTVRRLAALGTTYVVPKLLG